MTRIHFRQRRSSISRQESPILLDQHRRLATYDAFVDTAAASIAEAGGARRNVALLVADVDHYRLIAREYGEEYAELVLRTIVDLARANLREGELVAHPGGDEIVALLRASPAAACDVAERLCAAVRGHPFPETDRGGAPRVTISIGVACAPEHGSTYQALHAAADSARLRLKAQGRDGAALAGLTGQEAAARPLGIDRFAGRGEEFRTLVRYLDDANAGRPRTVAVIGEAGAGTAMLIRQLEPQVRLRGGSLVIGRAREQRVREPYGVWASVIAALHRLPDPPAGPWRELHHLVPAFAGEEAKKGARWGSKYRLLDEVAAYLRQRSQQQPLVVLLDEMQWADSASWDVLEHVCHQLDRERLLIALTFRTEPAHAEAAERRQSLTLNASYREILLSRLTRDEAKRWLEGAMHGQEVGRELLAFIYRHTEGNPLFIAQLLRALVEEGALWQVDGRWQWTPVSELRLPIGLSALIARRLSRLSSSTQAVLSIAAVIGDEFDVGFVVEAGAGSQAAVQLALSEALAAGVLRSSYERGGRGYAFTHAHIVEALLQSVPPDRLRAIHERIAEAIERRDRGRVSEIALHYDAAGTSVPAYLHSLIAAEHAEGVYAYSTANEFLHLAARNVSTPGELAEVRVRLASLAESTGRFDEVEEFCDLAIEWFEGHENIHRSLRLRCMRERARKELGQPAKLTLDALLALDADARRFGLERERVDILLMLSQTYGRMGDIKEAVRIARTCVEKAEEISDQMLLAQALNRLASLHPEEREEAEHNYRRALEIFQRLGDARGQARCHNNLANIALARNARQEARQSYSTAIALARSAGMPDLWGTAATNLGLTYHRSGDFERARELHGQALALLAAVKNSEIQLYALYNMAHIEWETGAWESGAELFEATASLAQRIGADDVEIGATAGVGLCKSQAGDLEAARQSFRAVEERTRKRSDWFQGRELVEALNVVLLSTEERFDEGMDRLEEVLPKAEASELYTAAWLTAVCARSLHSVRPDRMAPWLERYASQVQEYGYYEISKQLNNLRTR